MTFLFFQFLVHLITLFYLWPTYDAILSPSYSKIRLYKYSPADYDTLTLVKMFVS